MRDEILVRNNGPQMMKNIAHENSDSEWHHKNGNTN